METIFKYIFTEMQHECKLNHRVNKEYTQEGKWTSDMVSALALFTDFANLFPGGWYNISKHVHLRFVQD